MIYGKWIVKKGNLLEIYSKVECQWIIYFRRDKAFKLLGYFPFTLFNGLLSAYFKIVLRYKNISIIGTIDSTPYKHKYYLIYKARNFLSFSNFIVIM